MTVPPSTAPKPCLINHNARIYDPNIARFMSADSIIPDPTNGQSFNRYAYVSNNPLNAIDPSGYAGSCTTTEKTGCPPTKSPNSNLPCWGCWGPGWETDENGNVISTASQAFGSWDITINGQYSGTVSGRIGDLANYLFNLGTTNALNNVATNIFLNFLGFSGSIRFGVSSAEVIDIESGQSSIGYGLGRVTVNFLGGTYAYVPTEQSLLRTLSNFVGKLAPLFSRLGGVLQALSLCGDTPCEPEQRQFRHYGYASQATSFAGGLKSPSWATTASGPPMTGLEAQKALSLDQTRPPPDAYYLVTVGPGTPVIGPSTVKSLPGYPGTGGGTEYVFPEGTPPGSVTGPYSIPRGD